MLKKSCKNVLVGAMLLASLAMLLNGCGSDKHPISLRIHFWLSSFGWMRSLRN